MLHCPRLLWINSNQTTDASADSPDGAPMDMHETTMNRDCGAHSLARGDWLSSLEALFHIERTGSSRQALRALDNSYFDVVILETVTRSLAWRDAVETLAAHPAGVPVVVLKAGGDMADWGAALRSGAFDLVALPCRADALIAVCEHAVVTGEARRWHGVSLEEQFVSQVA